MCCVVQARENVLAFQEWVVFKDFFEGSSGREQFKYVGDANALTADTRPAAALVRFDCNPI
jgi:hypothetical protein